MLYSIVIIGIVLLFVLRSGFCANTIQSSGRHDHDTGTISSATPVSAAVTAGRSLSLTHLQGGVCDAFSLVLCRLREYFATRFSPRSRPVADVYDL
jgi:hypothetical protein